jgi:hypothetical protein
MCHDYQPGGRELRFVSSVAEQKRSNVQLRQGTTKQEYVEIRTAWDAKLEMPALILPAIQINIRAGEFPAPEANGMAYLKIPFHRSACAPHRSTGQASRTTSTQLPRFRRSKV